MTRFHVHVAIAAGLAAALILSGLPMLTSADSLGADREPDAPGVPGACAAHVCLGGVVRQRRRAR